MTRFTVTWSDAAIDELAAIWLAGGDRADITAAARAIDRDLSSDPQQKGAFVSEGLRHLDEPPLRVVFVVRAPDCIVDVVAVGRLLSEN